MAAWLIAGALGLLAAVLGIKLYLVRVSAREIARGLQVRRVGETNTLVDISSRDKPMRELAQVINRELAAMREKRLLYEQGDRELKEAVTNISHDLRTPLTAIAGYLELLRKEEDPKRLHRYLGLIQNRVDAMGSLSEELFRYSVVAASGPGVREPVDLHRALEESLLSFYGAFTAQGITPQITLPKGPVARQLEPDSLSRVFGNILSNALKYSDGDLSVTLDETGTVVFRNRAKALTAVSAARLFDRFYTVETGRDSTGLGLSIAKLLTERMGGTIAATWEKGQLSITLCFPG